MEEWVKGLVEVYAGALSDANVEPERIETLKEKARYTLASMLASDILLGAV